MVRVRFAPSPTGKLHVGNARTAVLNFLLARNKSGSFIVRIEDTDLERSEALFEDAILEDLRWLGLSWDEGPYRQSERFPLYREHVDRLQAEGHAYKCFCTKEELEHARADALRRGQPPRYKGTCRSLSESAVEAFEKDGKPFVVRLRPLEREISFNDGMHGTITFPPDHVDDFILLRQDGVPSYNLAAAVDDMAMDITHVIRGSDHLSNTPKQIMLFLMFGKQYPSYAHHGLLTGPDKKPLSKRHGAASVAEFRSMGVLPGAVVNYLGIMGRSTQHESLAVNELIAGFSVESFSGSDSVFDMDKLLWLNAAHIRALPLERLLSELGLAPSYADKVALLRENGKTLVEIKELLDIFDGSAIHVEAFDYLARIKGLERAVPVLVDTLKEDSKNEFEDIYSSLEKGTGLARRDVMMLLRIAITGRKSGPPLKEVFRLTTKQVILERAACLQKRFGSSGSV
jgi:glutamyl-tRNA synthetase